MLKLANEDLNTGIITILHTRMFKKLSRDMDKIKINQFELNIKTPVCEMKNTLDEIKQIRNCGRKY